MEWEKVIICSVVGFLGLLSAAMGFAAEATRVKASQLRVSSSYTCIYPSSPATVLGLGAAAALAVAQIIVGAAIGLSNSRQVSYRSDSEKSEWKAGRGCLYASWVAFIYALLRFIAGADVAERNENWNHGGGTVRCFIVKPGLYATGAVMSLAAVGLGILAYLAMDSAKNSDDSLAVSVTAAAAPPSQGGFAIGHPQSPPPPPQSKAAQLENRPLLAPEFSSEV